jgi:poly(A) polymerase
MLGWLLGKRKDPALPSDFKAKIDPEALKIVTTLQKNGFESYIVGGCVRDLLNGTQPKDFDIATSASPQKVKNLIARSFIIGRRFRIVVAKRNPSISEIPDDALFPPLFKGGKPHEKEIQITSFRRAPEIQGDKINENVFGTAKDDAFRRDFTVNGLFLDPSTGRIVDYVGGLKDIKNKQLRMIGDPMERFKEDPIRILRALRFSVRSRFTLEEHTEQALKHGLHLLGEAKKERVREEILKFFKEGTAQEGFERLYNLGAWKYISPTWDAFLRNHEGLRQLFFESSGYIDKEHWNITFGAAPLLYMFLYPLTQVTTELRSGPINVDQILQAVAEDLKISKIEKEEIQFIHSSLKNITSKPNWKFPLPRKESHILRQVQFSLVLHSLAVFRPNDYGATWKAFEPEWRAHAHWILASLRMNHKRSSSSRNHHISQDSRPPHTRRRRRNRRPRATVT